MEKKLLEMTWGQGEKPTRLYFLIEYEGNPVSFDGNLADDALELLKDQIFVCNSDDRIWRVVEKGDKAQHLYNLFLTTLEGIKELVMSGVRIIG